MAERPTEVQPEPDDATAGARALKRHGRLDPQPVPAPSIAPFLEPDLPPFVEE